MSNYLVSEIKATKYADQPILISLNEQFDFKELLKRSGKCRIEHLVCYNDESSVFDILIHEECYNWEKLYFFTNSAWLKNHNDDCTIIFIFSYHTEEDSPYWTYKFSPNYVLELLLSTNHNKVNITSHTDDGILDLSFALKQEFVGSLSSSYNELKKAVYEIEQELYLILEGGFKWKEDYHTDEPKFTKEVMIPLLKKMKYKNVRYNHGTEEYGRDVIFSEINTFGEEIFYGIQVKAGDISGGANSPIDTLIGQLEDAFSMPVKLLGDEHERYLSFFIIAISGYYKKNAKEKILKKVPQPYKQNVFFWDKDKIEDLTGTYWKAD